MLESARFESAAIFRHDFSPIEAKLRFKIISHDHKSDRMSLNMVWNDAKMFFLTEKLKISWFWKYFFCFGLANASIMAPNNPLCWVNFKSNPDNFKSNLNNFKSKSCSWHEPFQRCSQLCLNVLQTESSRTTKMVDISGHTLLIFNNKTWSSW